MCDQNCLHNGNCTHPNVCTCKQGWTGIDCSVALCAQDCKNGGKCVAPDTCQCSQWENKWRDGRVEGGVPLFKKPNGDPQLTGWTGYDCSTPICVQAERFRLNIDPSSPDSGDIVPLGGHVQNMECNEVRCPGYDEMVTQNDGKSFQSGCGWDILETGCCFEVNDSIDAYACFRCEDLEVRAHNATCKHDALKEWRFESLSKVPLTFKTTAGETVLCGPSLNPKPTRNFGGNVGDAGINVSTTSNMFLCNRFDWEQGDYIDDAGLSGERGIGADLGLKKGRHTRVNYNNYRRSNDDTSVWVNGPEVKGETIECSL